MTSKPKTISYKIIRLLKNNGSISEAKKAPVENIANVTEIFEVFIAAKNVIQCNAITTPAKKNLIFTFKGMLSFILLYLKKINIKIPAMVILYQTKGIACIVINSPKIAVKPAIKTKKCKCK
jgi:hypothetical protein